jgi:hypothetical protein
LNHAAGPKQLLWQTVRSFPILSALSTESLRPLRLKGFSEFLPSALLDKSSFQA